MVCLLPVNCLISTVEEAAAELAVEAAAEAAAAATRHHRGSPGPVTDAMSCGTAGSHQRLGPKEREAVARLVLNP